MPGQINYTRAMMAEDMGQKIDEASGLASMIASELDNGVNPSELVNAWQEISGELAAILTRVKHLAR